MNRISTFALLGLAVVGTSAHAVCDSTPLTAAEMSVNFADKTISFDCQTDCDGWMAGTSVDWHELHVSGGQLQEIGTGAGGVQPTAVVGSWATEPDRISYTYTGDSGSPHRFNVYLLSGNLGDSASSYEFCLDGTTTLKAIGTID